MTPTLQLRRLSVFADGKTAYSEVFRNGVNIIHGDNGSGKSTIADFIFFALGGDLRGWKAHAGQCDFVVAEVQLGQSMLTLKREVSESVGRPMHVYFGPYDEAMAAGPAAWNILPYKRPSSGLSFSQVLFRSMGIPDAISIGDSNITMHQILRLLYGDQMTPIQRIFRQENFDTWEMRQAVGYFVCGIGGHELYELQLELRSESAKYEQVSQALRSLVTVASSYGDRILAEQLEAVIEKLSKERAEAAAKVDDLLNRDASAEEVSIATAATRYRMRELQHAKGEVADLEDRIATLEYEIQDSARFVEYLEQSLSEFNDASATFFSLGHLRFEFCPSCFTPVAAQHPSGLGHCQLCGADTSVPAGGERKLAAKLDLEMQLKESKALAEIRVKDLEAFKGALRLAQIRLRTATQAADSLRHHTGTKRDTAVAELSRRLGYLDSELALLQRRVELSNEIARLSAAKESLNVAIGKLKTRIEATERAQDKRRRSAFTTITDATVRVLKQDLQSHSDFFPVESMSFSFAEDWMAVNGDKNRSRSASGMVILKNSFLVGLYLAALQDHEFLLPRFMLLDNIEDKGMVQDRSWNFQRVMIREVSKSITPHQLIFTTSMLAPELELSGLVVGRKFTRERPSLEFK